MDITQALKRIAAGLSYGNVAAAIGKGVTKNNRHFHLDLINRAASQKVT